MKPADSDISASRLRELVLYDADTGVFTRLRDGPHNAGSGCESNGYIVIGLEGRPRLAHRLAWLYMTGAWPEDEIDHINGDRSDNRWSNLRAATRRLNSQNQRRARSDNTTGYLGVTRQGSAKNPFIAKIVGRTGVIYLGRFKTAEAAHEAYVRAKRRMHEGCTL